MGLVEEEIVLPVSLAEAWDAYFDPSRWPAWVDSFRSIASIEGYPEKGGVLVWRSVAAGRGEVTERVEEHEPRRIHRVSFSDPTLTGEMTVRFAIAGEGARVAVVFDYRPVERGPMALFASLFVRSQVRGTVRRSLDGLARELGADQPG
ncbi:hypothetical protein BH24ACT23_BH24ACT23_07870 [soil metagenome]